MQPNVLIIVIDALRADRVGVNGGRDLTPNIDDLAADSMVFTNAFSTTNATDSAVTSIQTGRYPLSHGVVNHGWKVTDEEKQTVSKVTQLPEALSRAGYRTAKFGRPLGRWHRSGFDRYPETGEWQTSKETDALTEKEMKLSSLLENIDPRVRDVASWIYDQTGQRLRDIFSSEQTKLEIGRSNIVDELRSFVAADEPFFSFVHLMDTHTPYDVEREQTQQCLDRFDYSNQPLEQLATKFPEDSYSHERLLPGGRVYQTAKQWEDTEYGVGTAVVNAQYDASVKKADERVGNIIELLREQEILDETLLFVLSDHGESLTEHDILYDHHGLYDVSVRVPFIIRPPGGCDRSSSEDFVQITDIAPTVASYTDLSEFASVDGVSLRPAIDSAESIDRSQILADEANTQRRRMIRTTDEKLTYRIDDKKLCSYCEIEHAGPKEYYRLDEDPAEQTNLADEFQDRVKKFQEIAEKAADTFSGRAPDPGDMSIDYEDDEAEIRDRLEALGYR